MRHALFGLLSRLLCLFLFSASANAQAPSLDPSQTVNVSTGEMQFSLPLGVVQGVGEHNFPIDVSYHAGIQLHEAASPVGLGFSYGPGGISRKVVFVPDDNTGGTGNYLQDMSQFDNISDHCEKPWFYIAGAIALSVFAFVLMFVPGGQGLTGLIVGAVLLAESTAASIGAQALLAYAFKPVDYIAGGTHDPKYNSHANGTGFFRGGTDDQPDIYFVSTPFVSGELIWSTEPADPAQGGHFVFVKSPGSSAKDKQTVKVDYTLATETFQITLADGTRLIFDKTQKSNNFTYIWWQLQPEAEVTCAADGYTNQMERVPVEWLLTKVLFPDYVDGGGDLDPSTDPGLVKGSWISFDYDVVGGPTFYARPLPDAFQGDASTTITATVGGGMGGGDLFTSPNNCVLEEYYLRKVNTPNQSAECIYVNGRKDDLWFAESAMNWAAEDRLVGPMALHTSSKSGVAQPVAERRVLDRIVIRSRDQRVVRSIEFNTDYSLRPSSMHSFSKDQSGNFAALPGNPTAGCLTLESIVVSGSDGASLPPVNFTYAKNIPAWDPNQLGVPPNGDYTVNKMGFWVERKDYWGYFVQNLTHANDFNKDGAQAKEQDVDNWSMTGASFPTGASVQWEYEPQRYDAANNLPVKGEDPGSGVRKATKYGGGVRVKKMTTSDGVKSTPLTRWYFYTPTAGNFVETDGQSSGHATVEPYPYLADASQDLRADAAQGGLYTPAKVTYEMVQVVDNYQPNANPALNGTARNGYTVYEFTTPAYVDPAGQPFANDGTYGDIDNSWKRGLPTAISQYDKNGRMVSCIQTQYDFQSEGTATPGVRFVGTGTYEKWYDFGQVETGCARVRKNRTMLDGVWSEKSYNYADDLGSAAGVDLATYSVPVGRMVRTYAPEMTAQEMQQLPSFYNEQMGYSQGQTAQTKLFGNQDKDDFVVATACYSKSTYSMDYYNVITLRIAQDVDDSPSWNGWTDKIVLTEFNTMMKWGRVVGLSVINFNGNSTPDIAIVFDDDAGEAVWIIPDVVITGTTITHGAIVKNHLTPAAGHFDMCAFGEVNGNSTPDLVALNTAFNAANFFVFADLQSDGSFLHVYPGQIPETALGMYSVAGTMIDNGNSGQKNDLVLFDGMTYGRSLRLFSNVHVQAGAATCDCFSNCGGRFGTFDYDLYTNVGGGAGKGKSVSFAYVGGEYEVAYTFHGNTNFDAWGAAQNGLYLLLYDKQVSRDYNGQPNQIIETNSDGKKRISVSRPAGVDYADMLAKHMLTQTDQAVVYQDQNVPQNAVRASAVQYVLDKGRYLPSATWAWNVPLNNGTAGSSPAMPLAEFYQGVVIPANWQCAQKVTKYGGFSQVLESVKNPDLPAGGQYSTVVYDNNSFFPIAAVSNGRYGECLAMDFEELTKADIPTARYGSETDFDMATTSPHGGSKCLKIYKGTASDPYVLTWDTPDNTDLPSSGSRKIRWEFWAKADDAGQPLKSQTFIQTVPDNVWHGTQEFNLSTNWQKYSFEADVPYGMPFHITLRPAMVMAGGYITASPPAPPVYTYYDDVRAYPSGALMTSMSYDQVLGVPVAVTDANNNTRKTEYDGFGRVTAQYNTAGKKVNEYAYHLMGSGQTIIYTNHFEGTDANFTVRCPAAPCAGTLVIGTEDGTGLGPALRCEKLTYTSDAGGQTNHASLIFPFDLSGKSGTVKGFYRGASGQQVLLSLVTFMQAVDTKAFNGSGDWIPFEFDFDCSGMTSGYSPYLDVVFNASTQTYGVVYMDEILVQVNQ